MRKLTTLTIALAIGLTSGAAGHAVQESDSAAAAAASEAKPKPDKSKKICRTIVTSGTRFGTRYCRSREDWAKDEEHAQRYLEDSQLNNYRRDGEMSGQGMAGPPR